MRLILFLLGILCVGNCLGIPMKLAYGTKSKGLVLAGQDNTYYPMCVDFLFFNRRQAQSICNNLGLPSSEAINIYPYQFLDRTNITKAVKVSMNCSVDPCVFQPNSMDRWCTDADISKYKIAAVLCTDTAPEYRLTKQLSGSVGQFQIKIDGRWGPVCNDRLTTEAVAEVSCRSLNLPSSNVKVYRGLYNGGDLAPSKGLTFCAGNETKLSDCNLNTWQFPCKYEEWLGLSCDHATEGQVRLSGLNSGEVQIYHNQLWWGVGVSSNSYADKAAVVICKTLGLSTAVVRYSVPRATRSLWLTDLQCDGTEANITQCTNADVSSVTTVSNKYKNALNVYGDTGDEDIRLGADGHLEVRHNGLWGSICSEDLNDVPYDSVRYMKNFDASLVCKAKNLPSTLVSISHKPNSPKRSGITWLDGLHCKDTSTDWKQCIDGEWGKPNCGHEDDVYVQCADLDQSSVQYRLSKGPSPHVGVFEMSLNGVWGTMCDRQLSGLEAKVLCRSLNKPTTGARFVDSASAQLPSLYSTTKVWLNTLKCTGSENSVMDCTHAYFGDNMCTGEHYRKTVYCGPPYSTPDFSLRLVDGPNSTSGRLEMMLYGEWGTICNHHFNLYAARVACGQMKLPTKFTMIADRTVFKTGTGRVWKLNLNCDDIFSSCSVTLSTTRDCDHTNDVGIVCGDIHHGNGSGKIGIIKYYTVAAFFYFVNILNFSFR